jgi:hypothetical protein
MEAVDRCVDGSCDECVRSIHGELVRTARLIVPGERRRFLRARRTRRARRQVRAESRLDEMLAEQLRIDFCPEPLRRNEASGAAG